MRRAAVLGDLLEEVDVGVEEEAEAGGELVDIQPEVRQLHVGEAVGEHVKASSCGGRAGLADVVAEIDTEFQRGIGRRERDRVPHEPWTAGAEHELLLGLVLLQDVVLQRATSWARATAAFSPVATYMASSTAAGLLIVIDVVILARSMSR